MDANKWENPLSHAIILYVLTLDLQSDRLVRVGWYTIVCSADVIPCMFTADFSYVQGIPNHSVVCAKQISKLLFTSCVSVQIMSIMIIIRTFYFQVHTRAIFSFHMIWEKSLFKITILSCKKFLKFKKHFRHKNFCSCFYMISTRISFSR